MFHCPLHRERLLAGDGTSCKTCQAQGLVVLTSELDKQDRTVDTMLAQGYELDFQRSHVVYAFRRPQEPPATPIFVFGSNRQGRHGKGAALDALQKHGAVYGQATGRQGNSYGIITKELRPDCKPVTLAEVAAGVSTFLAYAAAHPELEFIVTPIGCGLAGFTPGQIAPLFRDATGNVRLPGEFIHILKPTNP